MVDVSTGLLQHGLDVSGEQARAGARGPPGEEGGRGRQGRFIGSEYLCRCGRLWARPAL